MNNILLNLVIIFLNISFIKMETILMTEVFAMTIEPILFNWTFEEINNQFFYNPSVKDKPDLPSWIKYKYSNKHQKGFLYGVTNEHNINVDLQIIALNRMNYETRVQTLNVNVIEKLNPAKYHIQMKIDNLNIEDMFDPNRMERLKDVFRLKLWRESFNDLYVTFLESAIQLGARLPLKPNEGEGVVLRLGSRANFSNELLELQEETKPLWKLQSCPRDFKRTTVERFFRESGFALDWCAFRLLEHEKLLPEDTLPDKIEDVNLGQEQKYIINSYEIPSRSYIKEFLLISLAPFVNFIIFVIILTLILCVSHEEIKDEESEEFFEKILDVSYVCKNKSSNFQRESSFEDLFEQPTNHGTPLQLRDATDMESQILSSPDNSLLRYRRPSPPPYPSSSRNF